MLYDGEICKSIEVLWRRVEPTETVAVHGLFAPRKGLECTQESPLLAWTVSVSGQIDFSAPQYDKTSDRAMTASLQTKKVSAPE